MPSRETQRQPEARDDSATGKAISPAPICSGSRKLPKPSCGAAVKHEKHHQRAVQQAHGGKAFGRSARNR